MCHRVTAGLMSIGSGAAESCLLACLLNMSRVWFYSVRHVLCQFLPRNLALLRFSCCIVQFCYCNLFLRGPGSSVGIATELRAGRSGHRIPVGARFSALVQTGPGAHPASCTMGTGSFPGIKRPGRDADPSPLLVRRSKNRVELYLYSP
jgi:hypothetical protein